MVVTTWGWGGMQSCGPAAALEKLMLGDYKKIDEAPKDGTAVIALITGSGKAEETLVRWSASRTIYDDTGIRGCDLGPGWELVSNGEAIDWPFWWRSA
jgi:hypothetical protein